MMAPLIPNSLSLSHEFLFLNEGSQLSWSQQDIQDLALASLPPPPEPHAFVSFFASPSHFVDPRSLDPSIPPYISEPQSDQGATSGETSASNQPISSSPEESSSHCKRNRTIRRSARVQKAAQDVLPANRLSQNATAAKKL